MSFYGTLRNLSFGTKTPEKRTYENCQIFRLSMERILGLLVVQSPSDIEYCLRVWRAPFFGVFVQQGSSCSHGVVVCVLIA